MRLPHLSSLKPRLALHTVLPCLAIALMSWVLFAGHYRSYRHLVRVRSVVDLSNRFSEIGEQLQAETNASMFGLIFAKATHDEARRALYERNYRDAIRKTDAMLVEARDLWGRIDKENLDPITRQRIDEGFQRALKLGAWRQVVLNADGPLPGFVTKDPYYEARLREHQINLATTPERIRPQALWDLLKERDYGGLTDYFGNLMLYAARVSEDAGLARRIALQAELLRLQTLADREDSLIYYFVDQGSRPHGLQPDDIGWLRSLWDAQRTAYANAWSLASEAERKVIGRRIAIRAYPAVAGARAWIEANWKGEDIAHWRDIDVKRIESPELDRELARDRPQGVREAVREFRERLMEDAGRRIAEQRRSMMMISAALLGAWGLLATSYVWSYRAFAVPVLRLAGTAAKIRATRDFSVRASVVGRDEIGQLAESFNGMLASLQASTRRLEEAAVFQHTLLECAGVGIVTTDAEGRVVSVNPAGASALGLEVQGPVPEGLLLAEALASGVEGGGGDRERVEAVLAALGGGGRVAPAVLEMTLRRGGGRGFPAQVTISALRDSVGDLLGYVAFLGDLSGQKEAEAAIRRANQELETRVAERTVELNRRVAEVESLNRDMALIMADLQTSEEASQHYAEDLREANTLLKAANQELEAFSYSVSHDLRAPLRNIGGFVELLRRRSEAALDADARHYVGIISGEAARLGRLIDDLLAFSRIGRAELKAERVDLAQLFEACRAERAAETAGRRIEWFAGPMPAVNADPTLMRLVIANLVDNAVKFTSKREQARIEFGCVVAAEGAVERVFFVKDNGAGFNPLYSGKLFQVFQRLHSQRDFEGTGIGLANVKRIVVRHGGRVWAEGAVDGGAAFYFTLPALRITV